MRKKYLIALLAVGMLTGIVACGTDKKPETDSVNGQVTAESSMEDSSFEDSSMDDSDSTVSSVATFTITIGEDEEGAIAP